MFARNFQRFPTVENPAPSDTAYLLYNMSTQIYLYMYNSARTRKNTHIYELY